MIEDRYDGIAIIGLSGRFPGAETVEELWSVLSEGRDTISFFSDAELIESGLDPVRLRESGQYVPARGVLKDADCFDAGFFGVHPKEAEVIDPQHRVFLETCWEALERSGYAPDGIPGSVGVFGGATYNTYYEHVLQRRPDLKELMGSELVMFGNEVDYLTTRVAYKLGLRGPAVNVSTACSTSLVAVCQACHSLLNYQCDMALAGGVSVKVPQKSGYRFEEGYIGSPDGHTRTFDAAGAGTVFGNGVGVVVLKRLEDALKDGDQIYAVIKGAALNNDGSQRVSFGAPGIEGQSEVIATAHALAGFDPATISYVEAHGTATPLGDPIEVAALTKAFRYGTEAKQFCGIGSVKSNLGHLDAAAGVTGLIKTALSLHNKTLPASLHFVTPNPRLELENTPFFVNSELRPWETPGGIPRRAGVSSFGSGGTNAHVALEEAPERPASGPSRPAQLLTLSAKTPEALEQASSRLADYLDKIANQPDSARQLADAAFTLKAGRSAFVHRRVVVAPTAAEAATVLRAKDPKRVFTQRQEVREAPVAFLFPGQGAQFAGMGAELYRSEPVFRAAVDACVEVLKPILDADIRELMFAETAPAGGAGLLTETRYTQPALFVIEYSLAKLWMSWGVQPSAMIGHSIGEYVAGCLSGVFSFEDALTLVARRAALVQQQPTGAMLAVRLAEREVEPLLNRDLSLAAINAANLCVVSGPHEAIQGLASELAARSIPAKALHTSHAFHSHMMEPVLGPYTALLRTLKFGEPRIPFVSNVTAQWITAAEATSPEYWAGHVRQTVRFADGVAELMKDSRTILLEVGPGQTLSSLARSHSAKPAEQAVFASLPLQAPHEARGLQETLGRVWMTGAEIDWAAYYEGEQRRRCVLPTYPFQHTRYWPEALVAVQPQEQIHTQLAIPSTPTVPVVETVAAPAALSRHEHLVALLREQFHELSGYDFSSVPASSDLLELGLDSLLLTQAAQLLQRRFKVTVTFRLLMEELNSIEAIATHLDAVLPAGAFTPAPVVPPVTAGFAPIDAGSAAVPSDILQQILLQQKQLTDQLQQFLGQAPAPLSAPAAKPAAPLLVLKEKSHGPFKPLDRAAGMAITPAQEQFLSKFIARYNQRTAKSKEMVAKNRPLLADPRSVAGFKQLWKEMVYPIVTTRSEGSRVWDVDGHEYVDFMMGFGASLFGHRPPFVVQAIRDQMDLGFEIGPIQPLAYEVAELMREFTGMQRVGFTNTGSEAVLAATRIARTVSGRNKIAVFAGSYHGIFDEVLFRPLVVNGEMRTAAIAPGIADSAVCQVIVLDYGNPDSLEIIRARGDEIAAVLVEPVQSRRLDLQPREFLHELRKVTQETGSALIFDEVVTGFRVHPGGAQAHFGIRADLATYGKVMGGGISIGVVAGDPKYMDALDGGQWSYGDGSFPEVGVTFFAGTFVRHPLSLAAAKAVLLYLKQQGPQLQVRLADRTAKLADELRALIAEFDAPYVVTQFSSLIQVNFPAEQKLAGLLFYLLRERDIHIFENRAFVITTAHSESDLEQLLRAFRDCLAELRSGEVFAGHAGASASSVAAIPAANAQPVYGRFPLTEPQREIWLAAQMGGEAGLGYNESLKLDFRGPFDESLFRAAVDQVVERHPVLMASIGGEGEWQQVPQGMRLDVPTHDLGTLSAADREARLSSIFDAAVSEPFDLTTGPLLRINIVRLSPEHHVVVWTAHHIVCDGWSTGLLLSEVAAIYSARKRGVSVELPAPASFQEYALSVQPDGEAVKEAVVYWREQFVSIPAPLELPTDHARPAVRSARAATVGRDMDAAVYRSLKEFSVRQRTTMVVSLMAGLKTLLHRLTGQTDVVIGLGAAGQAVTGNTCLVGHCLNLLPVRTQLDPDASFQTTLAAVKTRVLDAFDHHACTIGGLLQHLKVRRSASRAPLVEVIFNVDRDPGQTQFEGLAFGCERNPKVALHYDLFFNFTEGPNGLKLECDYNTDIFEAATIERWLAHYETLLAGAVAKPEEVLGRLPLLNAAERDALLAQGTRAVPEYPARTLHHWFEEQVAKTPDATAVTFEGRSLTYRELNQRSNRLAHHLRALGAGPDRLVGLYVERSFELVVGILGIVKAGAAYLPIDTVYPQERLAFMLKDAEATVLLTQKALTPKVSGFSGKVVCLDEAGIFQGLPDTNPDATAKPENLAYVIYTSGSTGKPKGTLITHRNVTRLMQATEPWYGFGERDVWTLFHSHAFDFSVWEIWGALLYGGRLVVVPYLTSRSPDEFYRLLADEQVTVLNQTPSAFKQLMNAEATLPNRPTLALRYVIFGGEALDPGSLKPWFDRHGDQQPRLVNMYGITETTVHVTYRPLSAADLAGGSVLGEPIPDLQVYILDAYGEPSPVGVSGELYVGGAGVARGYLNREVLSAERFLPDRFRPNSQASLYRTGDLARYLADGDIEYLGRIDDQVKLRGFRIELGEIESVLSQYPGVRNCVVVVREDTNGEEFLAAYFVLAGDSVPVVSDFRAFMGGKLPDYMIPSVYVVLTALPLTANGKTDRKALPAPDGRQMDSGGEFVAPEGPVEVVLAQIWSTILGGKKVGATDNFFDLGGHSLLAVRVMAEIEKRYQYRLPLATLLQSPTVAQLASVLEQRTTTEVHWSSLVPIRPTGSKPPLFLMHSHGGNVLEYYPLASHLGEDQPVYALQARGLDGNIPMGESLEDIATAYLKEIRSVQAHGPYYLGGFCFGGLVAWESARQLLEAGEEIALLTLIQTFNPLLQTSGSRPPSAFDWFRRGAKRVDAELEILRSKGVSHIGERLRRVRDVSAARATLRAQKESGQIPTHYVGSSVPLIMEALGAVHDEAFDHYVPRPYLGRTLLLRAEKQAPELAEEASLGWGSMAPDLTIYNVPGHQQTVLMEPNVLAIAHHLRAHLKASQPEETGHAESPSSRRERQMTGAAEIKV